MIQVKDYKKFLEDLLNSPSPSGYETAALEVFKRYCGRLTSKGVTKCYEDSMGNCAYSTGEFEGFKKKKSVLLSGHIDEIGYQVSMITEEGLLHILSLGGIDRKCTLGQKVEVMSSINNDIVHGVIGKKPIHVERKEGEYDKGLYKIEDILVDIGAETREEAMELVSVGDPIVFERNAIMDFGNNRIMSKGLDDKVGIFISAMVFTEILEENPRFLSEYDIICGAAVQEEVGLRGAMRMARNINPTYSIDIDVTFATDEERGILKEFYGNIKLGKGPVIMHGPDKSAKMIKIMKEVSKVGNIEFQEAIAGAGGTNTAAIQEFSNNTETVLLSIPQRNMHTPVEICDWKDIDGAVKLICHTLYKLL